MGTRDASSGAALHNSMGRTGRDTEQGLLPAVHAAGDALWTGPGSPLLGARGPRQGQGSLGALPHTCGPRQGPPQKSTSQSLVRVRVGICCMLSLSSFMRAVSLVAPPPPREPELVQVSVPCRPPGEHVTQL